MSKHKYTTAVCITVVVLMLAITVCFAMGESLGLVAGHVDPPYATSLFSTDKVHSLEIIVDETDWDDMLTNATSKEYITCHVVIDGNSVKNVAIRTKGNSSLSSIATSESDRYSFKIEFDHYDSSKTYQGLDKLALNNIAQDNTYLKDYVSYQMMNAFGADAPLSSFIYITVNGEDWGLYLAVEGIEEAFASRSYGSDSGQIYKPDSMDMNMGSNLQMEDDAGERPTMPENMPSEDGEMPSLPEGFTPGEMPEDMFSAREEDDSSAAENTNGFQGGGFGGGMGRSNSSDVALIYTDDNHESYSNIFDNAKSDPTDADKDRLIASIKQINEGTDLEEVVNIDEVLRYFVVHNYLLNFDSYTGSMVHNYYLYEEDGVVSMIAWDYNLAFGAFSMGTATSSSTDTATALVNYPIDTPTSGASMEDRPLLNQLLSNETYLEEYHTLFADFMESYFDSGAFVEMIDEAITLISPYVEKDPSAFCTYEEFLEASTTLKEFCLLRAESIKGQLSGTIGSTDKTQQDTAANAFIDASQIDIDVMGSNMRGFGGGRQVRSTSSEKEEDISSSNGAENADVLSMQNTMTSTTDIPLLAETIEEFIIAPVEDESTASSTAAEIPSGLPEDMSDFTAPEQGEGGAFPQGGFGDWSDPDSETNTEEGMSDTAAQDNATENNANRGGTRQNAVDASTAQSSSTALSTTGMQYLFLGLSFLLICSGICFAAKFKRW
ncbi:MAG: CotH kinase family protein [Christensenellaceae bacterium]|jgi:hypothetical protein